MPRSITLEDLTTDQLDRILDDDLVTVPGVELVRLGSWGASTGPITITEEDFDAMLAAAQDPEVDHAPIRRGHIDRRYDGEPALGWVENLRRQGDRLIGDLVDVPARIARSLRSAYRRRSVELAFGVRTPGGQRYRAVLSGLALLGVQGPAVQGLADVALSRRGAERFAMLAAGEDLGPDPAVAAATQRLLDAIDAIEAAGPPDDAAIAGLRSAADALTATTPPPAPTSEGRSETMDDARLRELLELEEGADVEAAIVALREQAQTGEAGQGGTGADDGGTAGAPATTDDQEEQEEVEEPELVGAALSATTLEELRSAGLAVVTQGALDELTSGVAEGRAARERQREEERERALTAALSAGRITPAERPTWEAQLQENHDGTIALLSALAPTVPTTERGNDAGETVEVDDEAWEAFESDVFGDEVAGTPQEA